MCFGNLAYCITNVYSLSYQNVGRTEKEYKGFKSLP